MTAWAYQTNIKGPLGPEGPPGPDGPPGPAGPPLILSDTAPPDPLPGTMWLETDTGNLFAWWEDPDSAAWVQVNVAVPVTNDAYVTVERFGAVANDDTKGAINDAAFSAAVAYAEANGIIVHAGAGTYYFATGFSTPSTGSYYRMDTNWGLVGQGAGTVLTRNSILPCDYTSETTLRASACIRWHSGNAILENMRFTDCALAIYRGQDPAQVVSGSDGGLTTPTHNRYRNIWIHNCGTGILDSSASGNHYNVHFGIHFWQNQICYHSREGTPGAAGPTLPNSNRNSFIACRAARSWVGWLMESSNGNVLTGCFGEKNALGGDITPTNNRYVFPVGVMYGGGNLAAALLSKPCSIYIGPYADQNEITNFFNEDSDWVVYNAGVGTTIFGGDFDEEGAVSKSIWAVKPALLIKKETFFHGLGLASYSNPNTELGGTQNTAGAWHMAGYIDHYAKTGRNAEYFQRSTDNPVKSLQHRWVIDGGTFTSAQVKTFDLQVSNNNSESSTSWLITVIGHSNASNLCHSAHFHGVSHRSSSSITRTWIAHQTQVVGTGLSTGTTTISGAAPTSDNFTAAFAVSGTILQLSLTAPARVLTRVTILVEETRALE